MELQSIMAHQREKRINEEVSRCFESMMLPNKHLYSDLRLEESALSKFIDKDHFDAGYDPWKGPGDRDSSERNSTELILRHKIKSLEIRDRSSPVSQISLHAFDGAFFLPSRSTLSLESNKQSGKLSPRKWPNEEKIIDALDESRDPAFLVNSASSCSSPQELEGRALIYSQSQRGCRYLQKILSERDERKYNIVFDELYSHFSQLFIDPFGNYLCQKLYEVSPQFERNLLMNIIKSNVAQIAMDVHGTRALQKIIDCSSDSLEEDLSLILSAISLHVLDLVIDANGNHVIQKLISKVKAPMNQFLYDEIGKHCAQIASHRHGCCVIQRALDYATTPQKNYLSSRIVRNAYKLIQDPFGNYVVQYVLDIGNPEHTGCITKNLLPVICLLSKQKFSSNAIEKLIRVSSPSDRILIVNEILKNGNVGALVCDSYANYVIQTALEFADPSQRRQLVNHVIPRLHEIRNTAFARKLLVKIQGMDSVAAHEQFK